MWNNSVKHDFNQMMRTLQHHEAMTNAVAEARITEHLWHQGWAAGIRWAAGISPEDLRDFAASLGPETER